MTMQNPLVKKVSYTLFEDLVIGETYPVKILRDYFRALIDDGEDKVAFKFPDSGKRARVKIDNLFIQVKQSGEAVELGWEDAGGAVRLITKY
jgi:hypothetical protein